MNLRLSATYILFFCSLYQLTFRSTPIATLQETSPSHFKFRRGSSGRAMKNGGIEVSFSRFTSDDGTSVERFVEDYKTGQAARTALQIKCQHSSEISRDGYRYDIRGKRTGRRVELLFLQDANPVKRIEVAWTDGPVLYVLRSESRDHLLDFEEQVYPKASAKPGSR
jgi:hypothetical protein